MAFNVSFNIYYSTSKEGPWTLANESPISFNESGQHSYEITGLKQNTLYFVAIVPGTEDDGDFFPLVSQHISSVPRGAGTIGSIKIPIVKAKTFAPRVTVDTTLSHQFEVV